MSKIMILTDSSCDLPLETIDELGITVLPFEINFAEKLFVKLST